MATQNGCGDPSAAAGDVDGGGPYIPAELIPDIAKHLTSLNDFFALRAGCRAYRAALPLRRDLLAAQPPCLLVPHSASPSLPLFNLLEPGCPSFSLALFHLPERRLHRFRARLPFARTGGVLASDGAQVVAVDGATGELIVTRLLTGAQVRLPKPPRTSDHPIQDWRIVNGALYGLLPTCGLVMASFPKDGSMELWLLGGEDDEQVDQALQESSGGMLLGDCGGEVLLIFKVGSIDPAYKIFRWDATQAMWARAMTLADACCSLASTISPPALARVFQGSVGTACTDRCRGLGAGASILSLMGHANASPRSIRVSRGSVSGGRRFGCFQACSANEEVKRNRIAH